MEDFIYQRLLLHSNDILPPVKHEINADQIKLSVLQLFDSENVKTILDIITTLNEEQDLKKIKETLRLCIEKEVKLLRIGISHCPEERELQEIAINTKFIQLVQGYGYFQDPDFVIRPHSKSSIKSCRYSPSRQDAVIYRASTVNLSTRKGAVIVNQKRRSSSMTVTRRRRSSMRRMKIPTMRKRRK